MQYPLSLVSIKYKHFILFGWGSPILNILVWFAMRVYDHSSRTEGEGDIEQFECLFMDEKPFDFWVIQAPMLVLLSWNTFFLIWIMWVRNEIFIENMVQCMT